MPTALPASSDFTGAGVTEGDFKSAITALRDYLSGLFGTDGVTTTALATLGAALSGYAAKTTTYAVIAGDRGKLIDATTGTWTLSLLAAATAGDGFTVAIKNSGSGLITVDPNLSETIDGGSTLAINAGESAVLYCNGTGWVTVGKSSGVPSGAMMGYGGGTVPSGWLLCYGQAISRTTYASLFAAVGTTHGVGDGSTTFNLPDSRGRGLVGKDDMGGSAANRLTTAGSGVDGATLGAAGGAQTHTLAGSEIPSHTHSEVTAVNSVYGWANGDYSAAALAGSGSTGSYGGGGAHNNVQPSLVANIMIKT